MSRPGVTRRLGSGNALWHLSYHLSFISSSCLASLFLKQIQFLLLLPGCLLLLLPWVHCLWNLSWVSQSENESHSVVSDFLWCHGLYSPWNSPGQNTGMGSLSLLQGIFPTQGSNPGLPHCRWILDQLSHKGSPRLTPFFLEWQSSSLSLICCGSYSGVSPLVPLLYSLVGFILSSQRILLQVLPSCWWGSPLTLVVCLLPGMVVSPWIPSRSWVSPPAQPWEWEEKPAPHGDLEQQSPTFWHYVLWRWFFRGPGRGVGFGVIQARYIYFVLYFYYYYISSTSDHWALDPGVWGPLI